MMSISSPRFPFGQPVREVVQTGDPPRRVFVLGVYASAVHARWIGPDGETKVKALAVASEPEIFWRGEEEKAQRIIDGILVPREFGKLVPASPMFNGPSGKALDELILNPLGLDREQAWLCDLVPHSCVNPAQEKAIAKHYEPLVGKNGIKRSTVPRLPKELADDARCKAILAEVVKSRARVLILLGDLPIKWFLKHFDKRWKRLSDFEEYGRLHEAKLDGRAIQVLPIAHPRQIAKLGQSSQKWFGKHETWAREIAPGLLGDR